MTTAHPAPASGGLLPLDERRLGFARQAFLDNYIEDRCMSGLVPAIHAWEISDPAKQPRPAPPAQPAGVSAELVELVQWILGSLSAPHGGDERKLLINHSIGPNAWLEHVEHRLAAAIAASKGTRVGPA